MIAAPRQSEARVPVDVRGALRVGLPSLLVGGLVLVGEPFGQPPVGVTQGIPGSLLNGVILAVVPPVTALLAYWAALEVPVRGFGLADGPLLGGGRGRMAPFFVLPALLPIGLYSRGSTAWGLVASLVGVGVIVGYLEVQRRLRPAAKDAHPVDPLIWVIQWDLVWVAFVAGFLAAVLAFAGEPASARSLGVVAAVVALVSIVAPTAFALAGAGRVLGWVALAYAGAAIAVSIFVAPATFALLFATTAPPLIVLVERSRRQARNG